MSSSWNSSWSHSRVARRQLLWTVLTVGLVLGSLLWWFGRHESEQLENQARDRLERTMQLAQVMIRQRIERGQTVLRAIASSGAVQSAVAQRDHKLTRAALQPFEREFQSTLLIVDDADGKPLSFSTSLAAVQLGVDLKSVEGRVLESLSVAAGDLAVRSQIPIEYNGLLVGRLRGAVILGRVFVNELSRDLQAPIAVVVDERVISHTFPSAPEVPTALRSLQRINEEPFDLVATSLGTLGESSVLVVGNSRLPIVDAMRRTRWLLWGIFGGGMALTSVAIAGFLTLGRAQEHLALQRDQAEQRSRAALDRLESLRAVVHDIKAPVSGIQLRCEAMLENAPPAPTARVLNQIAETCERLNLYLSNVLTTAEAERGGMQVAQEVVLLPGLIHELAERVEPLAQRRQITLKLDLAETMPAIRGDSALLERAMWNLAANAIASTPAGGCVTMFARHHDNTPVIGVEDTGPGFRDFLPELAFSRERPSVRHGSFKAGSSGLGLFIVSTVAAAHGGTAFAENLSSGGARVSVQLGPGCVIAPLSN